MPVDGNLLLIWPCPAEFSLRADQETAWIPIDEETPGPAKPLGPWVLEKLIGQIRKKIKTHPDAGAHAMRHTFLTETG